jgi:hypothetical protein
MKTIILLTMTLIASIGLLSTTIPYAHAVDVTSTATILEVCGLQTVPPVAATINYTPIPLAPNAESSEQTLTIKNIGNVQEDVLVKGTDWTIPLLSPNAMQVQHITHLHLDSHMIPKQL